MGTVSVFQRGIARFIKGDTNANHLTEKGVRPGAVARGLPKKWK